MKFLFCFIFDDLSTSQKKLLLRTSIKTRSVSKNSFVMFLLHAHYPTHSLSMVGDSLAQNQVREVGSKFDIRSSIFNVEMNMRIS